MLSFNCCSKTSVESPMLLSNVLTMCSRIPNYDPQSRHHATASLCRVAAFGVFTNACLGLISFLFNEMLNSWTQAQTWLFLSCTTQGIHSLNYLINIAISTHLYVHPMNPSQSCARKKTWQLITVTLTLGLIHTVPEGKIRYCHTCKASAKVSSIHAVGLHMPCLVSTTPNMLANYDKWQMRRRRDGNISLSFLSLPSFPSRIELSISRFALGNYRRPRVWSNKIYACSS